MKKIFFLFLFTALAMHFTIEKIQAAPASPWIEVIFCDDAKGYHISEVERRIQVRYINDFYPEHPNICLTYEIGSIQEDQSYNLSICPRGYIVPRKNDKPDDYSDQGCCPAGYNYFYNKQPGHTGTNFCLADTSIPKDSDIRDKIDCSNNIYGAVCPYLCGEDPAGVECDGNFIRVHDYNQAYFFEPYTEYMCKTPNCVYSANNLFEEDNPGPYDESEISGDSITCTVDNGVNDIYTCVKGRWYPTSILEEWKGKLGEFLTCNDFADENEKTTCLDCYGKCPTENTCSYSSLGCIQTTQNGMVVRIFQIGLGIVGALAIARFIQAALLRQTADPSKIQESYDIITSIIIGIVVLLGSTVILRFIGIDILQMMPF